MWVLIETNLFWLTLHTLEEIMMKEIKVQKGKDGGVKGGKLNRVLRRVLDQRV